MEAPVYCKTSGIMCEHTQCHDSDDSNFVICGSSISVFTLEHSVICNMLMILCCTGRWDVEFYCCKRSSVRSGIWGECLQVRAPSYSLKYLLVLLMCCFYAICFTVV